MIGLGEGKMLVGMEVFPRGLVIFDRRDWIEIWIEPPSDVFLVGLKFVFSVRERPTHCFPIFHPRVHPLRVIGDLVL